MHEPRKRLVAVTVGAFLVGFLFAALYLTAFHSPRPHDLPVAVAAPPPVVSQMRAAVDRRAPGALDLRPVQDEGAAIAAVRRRDVDGAIVLAPGRQPELLVASA